MSINVWNFKPLDNYLRLIGTNTHDPLSNNFMIRILTFLMSLVTKNVSHIRGHRRMAKVTTLFHDNHLNFAQSFWF